MSGRDKDIQKWEKQNPHIQFENYYSWAIISINHFSFKKIVYQCLLDELNVSNFEDEVWITFSSSASLKSSHSPISVDPPTILSCYNLSFSFAIRWQNRYYFQKSSEGIGCQAISAGSVSVTALPFYTETCSRNRGQGKTALHTRQRDKCECNHKVLLYLVWNIGVGQILALEFRTAIWFSNRSVTFWTSASFQLEVNSIHQLI